MAKEDYKLTSLLTSQAVKSTKSLTTYVVEEGLTKEIYDSILNDEYILTKGFLIVLKDLDGGYTARLGDGKNVWSDSASLGGGSPGGGVPIGTNRQVLGYEDGVATPVTLGWSEFSDLDTPPPFTNGALIGSGFAEDGSAQYGFLEIAIDNDGTTVARPNTLALYTPGQVGTGGGTLKVQNAIQNNEAAALGQLPKVATVAPLANGTATVGTSALYARQDHVHPLQASVAMLTTGRTIGLSGGATGTSASFNGSGNATIPVTLATPTLTVRGGVLQQPAIPDIDGRPIDESDYNTLLAALRTAGLLAT